MVVQIVFMFPLQLNLALDFFFQLKFLKSNKL
uniref:Uncharacterized protein n=1 Tax=Rhizophora mucronata TaxID=61149 RepID=A0A2P2QH95_RHIMU